ncbi:MAG: response regulator [Nitrospiraceae bacterium]|nr:response regulator [Nitrospiraceae bacterium]
MKNQSIKVLVVDDEEQIRGLFCTVLRSAGYVVRAATDGLTTISHMEDTRFDIVVTDVCMP